MCLLFPSEWIPQSRVYPVSAVPATHPNPLHSHHHMWHRVDAQSLTWLNECMFDEWTHTHAMKIKRAEQGMKLECELHSNRGFCFSCRCFPTAEKRAYGTVGTQKKYFKNKFTRKEHFWKWCRKSGDLQTPLQCWNISKSFAGRPGLLSWGTCVFIWKQASQPSFCHSLLTCTGNIFSSSYITQFEVTPRPASSYTSDPLGHIAFYSGWNPLGSFLPS